MTKITIADTQTTHPLLSAPYIGDLMTQFDNALSQSTQDEPMTLTEIAQTFPPMWQWSHQQEQTVAKAISGLVGQTFICNHPNMQGVETTVVEQHPHSSGCTLELHSPSRSTHQNHSCDVFHFVEFYTPKTQDKPMTITCNLETFISMFATETDAIDHILISACAERVETTEYTIPYYTYNRLANPPRFIAYSNHAPELYSYEVRIVNPDSNDILIEFPRTCHKSMTWFSKHLINRLSDGWGEFESDEVNITDEYELERTALNIQREINFRRIHKTRRAVVGNEYMAIAQFEQNCRDVVAMLDENKAITERIEYLNQ